MSVATRDTAHGELYVCCPRGHEVHIAYLDRPIAAGDLLDPDERAAVHAFAWGTTPVIEVTPGAVSDAKCPSCAVMLHGQSVQGRTL